MENPPISKNGKPSISMGHLYHGYVSHNQRVTIHTMWGPRSIAKLVHNSNVTMVYGTQNNELVTGANLNQQT